MRILICGDRNWTDRQLIFHELVKATGFTFDVTVIEGEARGADTLGKEAAILQGMAVEGYPANWKRFGNSAGPIRNQEMLDKGKPDLVLAFHDDIRNSKGTKDMIARAKKAGIHVELISHEWGEKHVQGR